MDRNFLLAVVLSMLVFTVWMSTQERPEPGAPQPAAEQAAPAEPATGAASAAAPERAADAGATREAAAPPAAASADRAPAAAQVPLWRRTFESDSFRAVLTNRGGALESYALLDYEEWGPHGEIPVDLVSPPDEPVRVGTTPFTELGIGDLADAHFSVEATGDFGATFVLERGGITVRKIWSFDRDAHTLSLAVEVQNGSAQAIAPRFDVEWPSRVRDGNEYRELALIARHGPEGEVTRVPIGSVGSSGFLGFGGTPDVLRGGVDWFGVETRYFVGALAPKRARDAELRFVPIEPSRLAAAVLRFDTDLSLPPGQGITQQFRGYIGPKIEEQLEAFGSGLEASINLGWSWVAPLTRFFTWLLKAIHSVVPNYGIAIILLTLLVRVATLPILQKQMQSMEKMKQLQPRMKELQEKYGDDRERQSQEMLKLYKETGANPLGGCLPMLLQLPVFIGLFYALQSSIELRHAPFMLWINDLSAPDTLFVLPGLELPVRVLPILMAASMVLQAKLQPMSPDPQQARMMTTIMPIMMLVLFYQFPSGLVLYYTLSNFLGILHQRWVARKMEAAKAA